MNTKDAVSPLRYPGGKQKLFPLVKLIICKAGIDDCTYVEPFAGGAGVALSLLFEGPVQRIVINDYDRAVASFWKAVLLEPDRFIDKIQTVPLTVEEWKKQQDIYYSSNRYSFDFGFSAFFLNRTNHSGILKGGPIGGFSQTNDKYNISTRFNRASLSEKIQAIKERKGEIKIFNQDARSFIKNQLPKIGCNAFIYFDPPYYNNGRRLYKNFYEDKDHRALASEIMAFNNAPWIVSYDNVPEIREMYSALTSRTFSLSYSLANNGRGEEVIFFKTKNLCPTKKEILDLHVNISNWN